MSQPADCQKPRLPQATISQRNTAAISFIAWTGGIVTGFFDRHFASAMRDPIRIHVSNSERKKSLRNFKGDAFDLSSREELRKDIYKNQIQVIERGTSRGSPKEYANLSTDHSDVSSNSCFETDWTQHILSNQRARQQAHATTKAGARIVTSESESGSDLGLFMQSNSGRAYSRDLEQEHIYRRPGCTSDCGRGKYPSKNRRNQQLSTKGKSSQKRMTADQVYICCNQDMHDVRGKHNPHSASNGNEFSRAIGEKVATSGDNFLLSLKKIAKKLQ